MPARFIGQDVRVLLRGNELLVFERRKVVARHPRLTRRGEFRDELDHYLEMLLAKPGAMAGSTALATARQNGSFTEVHEAFCAAARTAHRDAAGTRALIEVLMLHRRRPAEAVQRGMAAAIRAGAATRHPRRSGLGQGRPAALPDRLLGHRQVAPADRHRHRRSRVACPLHNHGQPNELSRPSARRSCPR
ncbi:hypothetical protein SAV31267_008000 [Streptomyces avermitilis]|uniref:Transposase for insertion sequence element IS21-like C-terminal domain-containing protein n=1 Tax=Streptomyces avermitilis TaxID=33903 RepID=A0A4D4MHZ1_STRAX|nr:hypothetical protein SAV31267_008000 [Streptomyces avermitilis]